MEREKFLSLKEAVRELNVSEPTLRLWDKVGKIKSIRNYRGWRFFPESEITRIKESLSACGKPKQNVCFLPESHGRKKSSFLELFRVMKGISMTKLAEEMGVSWTRIKEILEGDPLEEEESDKLTRILGIDLEAFSGLIRESKAALDIPLKSEEAGER
jgi:DNA-binding transcriptional MerR regulator